MPAKTWWQHGHSPQPPSRHSSAAANARAATDRPDPGGPVNSQAWVIAPVFGLAAGEQGRGRGGRLFQLSDHRVLAGQVAEDAGHEERAVSGAGAGEVRPLP